MKTILSILLASILVFGCNGEKIERPKTKAPEPVVVKESEKKPELIRTANYVVPITEEELVKSEPYETAEPDVFGDTKIEDVKINLDHGNGYVISGNISFNSFIEGEEDCIGKVLRKDLKKYRLYIIEDCNGNQAELIVER